MGEKCLVITVNSTIRFLHRKKELSALEQRWVSRLAQFDLTFKYRPGKNNIIADTLSRRREEFEIDEDGEDMKELFDEVKEILHIDVIDKIDKREMILDQKVDVKLKDIVDKMRRDGHSNRYIMEGGILFEKKEIAVSGRRLMVPRKWVNSILEGLHDQNGHQGVDRTLARIGLTYNWIGKYADVRNYIAGYRTCNIAKNPIRIARGELGSLVCSRPGEILFIDFVTLDRASDGRENVQVMFDGYSKLVKDVVTRNQTAETVVNILLKEWIFVYGTPEKIHSDQGSNFTSKIVKGLCDFFNIKKSQTTPYYPMGNGQVEQYKGY